MKAKQSSRGHPLGAGLLSAFTDTDHLMASFVAIDPAARAALACSPKWGSSELATHSARRRSAGRTAAPGTRAIGVWVRGRCRRDGGAGPLSARCGLL